MVKALTLYHSAKSLPIAGSTRKLFSVSWSENMCALILKYQRISYGRSKNTRSRLNSGTSDSRWSYTYYHSCRWYYNYCQPRTQVRSALPTVAFPRVSRWFQRLHRRTQPPWTVKVRTPRLSSKNIFSCLRWMLPHRRAYKYESSPRGPAIYLYALIDNGVVSRASWYS